MNPDSKPITIVPSYPADSFRELQSVADAVAGVAQEFQVDIVDGDFVTARSWPFNQDETAVRDELLQLSELPENLMLEMDCMVLNPEQYLDTFVSLGVSRVVIHHNSDADYEACLDHAIANDYLMGIAVLPTVRLGSVARLIEAFDYVQVMGIYEVGRQGQGFAPETLDVIASIKTQWPEKEIAIDGAVNADTIPALVAAGATRLAPGSAIVGAPDPAAAYESLVALVSQGAA